MNISDSAPVQGQDILKSLQSLQKVQTDLKGLTAETLENEVGQDEGVCSKIFQRMDDIRVSIDSLSLPLKKQQIEDIKNRIWHASNQLGEALDENAEDHTRTIHIASAIRQIRKAIIGLKGAQKMTESVRSESSRLADMELLDKHAAVDQLENLRKDFDDLRTAANTAEKNEKGDFKIENDIISLKKDLYSLNESINAFLKKQPQKIDSKLIDDSFELASQALTKKQPQAFLKGLEKAIEAFQTIKDQVLPHL